MSKTSTILLLGTGAGTIYFYRESPFVALVCFAAFLLAVADARAN